MADNESIIVRSANVKHGHELAVRGDSTHDAISKHIMSELVTPSLVQNRKKHNVHELVSASKR